MSANAGLTFNPGFFIPLFKSLFELFSSILFRAFNYKIKDKKNCQYAQFSFKALRSKVKFYTNTGSP